MDSAQRDRYLALLRLDPEPPSLAALSRLVTAHLARFPFENVSKLVRAHGGLPEVRRPWLPSLDEFLAAAARDGTGGTCYVLNTAFHELLRALDYAVELVGADMDLPDVHVVVVARLDGRRHLVDVGYGAPLFAPLPLDAAEPVRVRHGREEYVLHPADPARRGHRLDHLLDGEVVHGYTAKPEPRALRDFYPAIAGSYRDDAPFLNRLRIIRHTPARSVSLRDFKAVISEGGRWRPVELGGRGRLLDFVEAEFGFRRATVAAACDALAARGHAAFR